VPDIPLDLEIIAEARLVAEARGGSQPAFEQIVRRYQRPVIGLIARMTGDPALAEDLAQDTFVKAFRNLGTFDPTRRLSSWLFRIAHNTTLDALRRIKPEVVALDAFADGDRRRDPPAPPAADRVEQAALGAALAQALQTLRPGYRAAIALRYDQDLPFDEIGQILGVPEVTARTYVHRARKELAQSLEAIGWTPSR
jgi:RNA polymerase sigma-70 factor (ECF subfamily)